jgi:hypothetical protein
MNKDLTHISVEDVENSILSIRGERVILDSALAKLYGVTTERLNQQVRRNAVRFPPDFMFELTKEEHESLILQFARSKRGRGGRRKLPLVFTEYGAIMAANVLNSQQAVRASVEVVRAFVGLRQIITSNAELARKLDELEKKYDRQFKVVFDALRELMARPTSKHKQIGFNVKR